MQTIEAIDTPAPRWQTNENAFLDIAQAAREYNLSLAEMREACLDGIRARAGNRVDVRTLVGKMRHWVNECDGIGAYHIAMQIEDELRNMEEV